MSDVYKPVAKMLCQKPPGTHSVNNTEAQRIESQNHMQQRDKSLLAKRLQQESLVPDA